MASAWLDSPVAGWWHALQVSHILRLRDSGMVVDPIFSIRFSTLHVWSLYAQRAQFGLIKEYSLNDILDPYIIQAIFLN